MAGRLKIQTGHGLYLSHLESHPEHLYKRPRNPR